ncbi:hypothetical protein [Ahrensia sp. R2A130]|uniref:hypothetical protein n=1 Tax=Ahrensia sp. R2A130 TaxID=744979 RepID=UPI0001E0AC75|nr:hypothetical protein [Ahrensia sp. R2A130]EFL90698.1 hypothetical protein R2A130_0781 [Ahrensia sp. R2A130]
MKFPTKALPSAAFALSSLAAIFAGTAPATAQSINLSNDDATILRVLEAGGFREGKVVTRGLTIVRTHACRGDSKFLVKVSILGRITSTTPLGNCDLGSRPVAKPKPQNGRNVSARVQAALERQGYRRIVVTDAQPPRITAEACNGDDRVRVAVNRRGQVRSERRIGPCERQFDPGRLVEVLEQNGFDRVEVTQTRRPPYTALACRGNDRMEVSVGRFGRLRDQQRVGACQTDIKASDIPDILTRAGFDRIRVLQRRRAPYLAEACSRDRLVEVSINRYGEIGNRQRVGRCASAMSKDDLIAKLQRDGYSNLNMEQVRDGWRVSACRGVEKVGLRIDSYGDTVRQQASGKCTSETVLDVLTNLEDRGAEKLQAQVEGCFKNDRYRWTFDRLGNRIGRERLGRC